MTVESEIAAGTAGSEIVAAGPGIAPRSIPHCPPWTRSVAKFEDELIFKMQFFFVQGYVIQTDLLHRGLCSHCDW